MPLETLTWKNQVETLVKEIGLKKDAFSPKKWREVFVSVSSANRRSQSIKHKQEIEQKVKTRFLKFFMARYESSTNEKSGNQSIKQSNLHPTI